MKRILSMISVLLCVLLALGGAIAEAPATAELSDDPYSFELLINGEKYAFPMTYADFTAKGWVYKNDEAEKLDASYYSSAEVFTLGDLRCYADIINFDINAAPISQCYIGGISFDEYEVKKAAAFSLTMPGGLEYGAATAEQAQALYGTPSRTYEGDLYTKYTYTYESYREIELTFSAETGALNGVDVRNLETPADFVPSAVSDEVPAVVTAYAAPSAMSDRLADFTATYGGVIYQLPVPVSVMIDNGWRLVTEDSEATVDGRDSGWVTLMMDNQRLRVLARNYSGNATAVQNCFVCDLESGDDLKIELIAAKGLTVGMSEADLLAALEGENVEKDEGSSYVCYTVKPAESGMDRYDVYVRDDAVYKLEMAYSPNYADYAKE